MLGYVEGEEFIGNEQIHSLINIQTLKISADVVFAGFGLEQKGLGLEFQSKIEKFSNPCVLPPPPVA